MAPKKKFSKEQIIDAAFEIAKKEGMETISIRKVAEKLGSSIAPIYVNFSDVDELKKEVMKKIIELSNQLLSEQNSGHPFRDIGVASLRFASEYSVLFRDLVMKQTEYMENYDEDIGHGLVELMKGDSNLEGFSEEELMTIFFKMRVFTVGLSVMVANGLLPKEFSEERGIELLNSTATDVITSARLSKGMVDEPH
ncbi:TetR/AcrR family transcriptional regulator [Bacillus sp. FJAT-49732]|uniref:TetR/AcrR family transcriptional regulator n=1 Tax=Lederbergia citrisecunda TaxID=2833583 RepID=A0A942YM51_9BACI|nr:TetR/AcrR family transcriptional regulator [Lederbergia citrisecunda]MBS4202173.1 TetR/AcrR family transcriptional regulator [Lederbergia citrisecunda]